MRDSGLIVEFLYDAQGRRARKTVATPDCQGGYDVEIGRYCYSGWQVLYEKGIDKVSASYVYGSYIDEILIADIKQPATGGGTETTRYYVLADEHYSVAGLATAEYDALYGQYDATLVEAYQYDPHGRYVTISDNDDLGGKWDEAGDIDVEFDRGDTRALSRRAAHATRPE